MRSSFIDKVYDTYISSDFTYGDDNLNPVREITIDNNKSLDDKIAEIYAELNKRVDNLKKTVSNLTGESTDEYYSGNTTSENNNGTDDYHLKNVIGLTGGSGDKLVVVPSFESEDDPMSLELELMFLEKTLAAYYPDPTPPTTSGDGDNTEGPYTYEIPPFNPDCKEESLAASKKSDDTAGNIDTSDNQDNSESDSSGSSGSSSDVDSNAPTIDASRLADALDDALTAAEDASNENEKTEAECAKAELGILKVILAVLKVIKIIKGMLDPALPIIMQAVKLVQLAAQCWNNPTCIAVIIQRVLGTVIAILIGVVAQLIAEIWKMLGLDCFSEEVQEIMDEIREALAAISGITSELDPTGIITDVKTAIGSVEDTFDTVSNNLSSLSDEMSNIDDAAKTALRNTLNMYFPGFTDENFTSFLNNKRYRAQLLNTLKSTMPDAVQSIESAVDTVLNVPDTVMSTYDTIKNVIGTLSSEKQLMASLEDVKKF